MSHHGLAIYIKKYLKAKEGLWKLTYFTMQKYNLQKILQKKPKSFKIYYNSITNLKFQPKPKVSSFKNPHIKIDLLPKGKWKNPKSLKLLYSIMNLNIPRPTTKGGGGGRGNTLFQQTLFLIVSRFLGSVQFRVRSIDSFMLLTHSDAFVSL